MAEGFQFKFFDASDEGQPQEAGTEAELEAHQVSPRQQQLQQGLQNPTKVDIAEGIELLKGTVTSDEAAALLGTTELKESDLVPNVYEGGFKLWEGAVDLCRYLCKLYRLDGAALKNPSRSPLAGKKVLELGCGHGLPGVLCLLAGAQVHFQDYNEQVITQLTIPNVTANLAAWPVTGGRWAAKYYAGDWLPLGSLLSDQNQCGYYDIVLTSETIYSQQSQGRLLECIKQVLEPPHGVAYVAAKSYYFGVGGGTHSFQQLVKEDNILDCEQVWKVEDGTSNKREILKLSFPASIAPYFM